MKNPWLNFVHNYDDNNMVLDEEKKIISEFNNLTKDDFKIHTYIAPAPFMGNVENSEIVILMLNPGYTDEENMVGYYEKFKNFWINEIQRKKSSEFTLFCLDKEYCEYSDYWSKKLNPLIEISSKEKVSEKISKIQFFPYHSKKFKNIPARILKKSGEEKYLLSQKFNFELVENAMQRNALIIIPRAKKYWEKAVPNLVSYSNKLYTNSYQNIILSENNLGKQNFDKIKKILNS